LNILKKIFLARKVLKKYTMAEGQYLTEIIIEAGNAMSLLKAPPEKFSELSELLSYESEAASFVSNPFWDGRVRFINKAGLFPTGLLNKMLAYLESNSIPFKFIDSRVRPTGLDFDVEITLPFPPRYYQSDMVLIARENNRGVFVVGTGGGKSASSALVLADKKIQTLFVAPDTGLRKQIYNDYCAWFGEDKVGTKLEDPKPIIVANIQSIAKKDKELFQRFGMLILDEVHHCFDESTMVTIKDRSRKSIKDIYDIVSSGKKIRVKSWDGEKWVMKNVIKAFKYRAEEILKVRVQDEDGRVRELLVTANHKFLTDNGKKEIGSMSVGDELVLGYNTHAESMRRRSSNPKYRNYLSDRMKKKNPTRLKSVRKAVSKSAKTRMAEGSMNPYGRGVFGNGGELTPTQKLISEMLRGSTTELSVALKDGERPHHYKVDVAIPSKMIGIEVDGSSHKCRKLQDERKDLRLRRVGWKIVRIPENCSKEELSALKRLVAEMSTT
jgi:very-short-patch-repair endonuclease